jgi:hypothetical protein
MLTRSASVAAIVSGLLVALFAGCGGGGGGGTPTDPGALLTLTASPTQIGRTATSTLTALGKRSNGTPVATGTQIRFATTLGSIAPATVLTDANGRALATLRADGRTGAATVTATMGSDTAQATVTVVTGLALVASATPPAIPLNGTSELAVQARESNGDPTGAGTEIRFATTLGRLDDPRPVTDNLGIARTKLRGTGTAGIATVTADTDGAVGPARVEVAIGQGVTLAISADPGAIGPQGTTQISVLALAANGQPVPTGTLVELTTTLGNLDNVRPSTDSLGLARTTLRADGRTGDARVTATVTGGVASVTVVVPIR